MTESLEVELVGTGQVILDGAAELLFDQEFKRAFARPMIDDDGRSRL